jgi:Dolichyl-phosphate-mannose-protein mannosyltransferase
MLGLRREHLDPFLIVSLGVFSFFTLTLFLLVYGKTMFNIDSYTYLYTAVSIAKGSGESSFSPFINIMALVIRLLGNSDDLILPLRIMNIIFSVQLIIFIFLIARKIFNVVFSAFTALMALFLPLFQSYAITLHNDIFAASMGFTSLYLIIKPKLVNLLLATLFFFLAILTRPDTFPIYIIPLLLGITIWIRKSTGWNVHPIFTAMIIVIVIGVVYIGMQNYYYSTTRFNPIQKFVLFIRLDTLRAIWESSVAITGNDLLDTFYPYIIAIGMSLSIFIHRAKILNIFRLRAYKFEEADLVALYLTFGFITCLVSLIIFHIPYTIVNNQIIVDYNISPRYFIPIQLFMVYAFVYALSVIYSPLLR